MKNLQGLTSFVEAANVGSLSAAARKLDLTPAGVSKNVLRLEEELGVRLFNRSTRRLRLTAEGEVFLPRAAAILRAMDEAVAEIAQATETPQGRVRISAGASFGRRWVAPALPELLARYPGLQVELDLDNRRVDLVAEGFDISIRGGVIEDSSLIARRVCALPVALVASPDYLLRRGTPRSVEALAEHECVGVRFATGVVLPWRFRRDGDLLEVTPATRLSVSEPEVAVELAVAGAGVAQAGVHHVLPHLREGRLKVLLLGTHESAGREIVLHYPHRQYLAPRVRATVEYLLGHFSAAADLHVDIAELHSYAA